MNGSRSSTSAAKDGQANWRVLCSLAIGVFASLVSPCRADNAASTQAPAYVLLRNDHVFIGTVSTEDHDVVIQRDGDSTIRVAAHRVVGVSRSEIEVVDLRRRFLARRGPAQSHRARVLVDSRWCLDNRLFSATRSLLSEVLRSDPEDAGARQLWWELQAEAGKRESRDHSLRLPAIQLAGHADHDERRGAIQQASFHTPPSESPYSLEDLGEFASRIQPILLARCAGCHKADVDPDTDQQPDAFLLRLPSRGARPGRETTVINLRQVDRWLAEAKRERQELRGWATRVHWPLETFAPTQPAISAREEHLLDRLTAWCERHDERVQYLQLGEQIAPQSPGLIPDPTQGINGGQRQAGLRRLPEVTGRFDSTIGSSRRSGALDPQEFNRQTAVLMEFDVSQEVQSSTNGGGVTRPRTRIQPTLNPPERLLEHR
ncbi:MAG: hypothetical protein AAGD07_12565 [Planctomycetota bacterium]